MTDKNKHKLFSAPSIKIPSGQGNQAGLKEKIGKPVILTQSKDKKDNCDDASINPKKFEKNAIQKQKVKSIPKSLTDEEYADIFQSVLDKSLNDACSPVKDWQSEQQLSPKTHCRSMKKSDDEIDLIASCEKVDQWDERSDDGNKKVAAMEKKKKSNKQGSQKKTKKSKKEISNKASKELNKDNEAANNICVDSEELNDSEEESGTWIQCSISECGKWRYVADISDPIQVPEHWNCRMNSDKDHNSCHAQEVEYDESDHILTQFTLGSVVWAKMDGFPWWPAMVDTDPDYDTYFQLPTMTSMIPTIYHVTFFDERVSRAWIRSHLITPYNHKSVPKNNFSSKPQAHKKELEAAITNAETALDLNLKERLDQYSFIRRYPKTKTLNGKFSRRQDKKRNSQTNEFAGEKANVTEEILSGSSMMLKELDMAITSCNNSDDEDSSVDFSREGKESEDKAPSELHQDLTEPRDCATPSQNTENIKVSSSSVESDKDITKLQKDEIKGNDNEDKIESDSVSLKVDNLPEFENQIHEDDKPLVSVGVIDENNDLAKDKVISKSLGGVKNKLEKEKKKRKIKDKNHTKDTLSTRIVKNDNELKHSESSPNVPQTMSKRDIEPFVTELDSEKENKDPKNSKCEKLSRKRKVEKHFVENFDNNQEKIIAVGKKSTSEPKSKRSTKEQKQSILPLAKQKNPIKSNFLPSDDNEMDGSINENQIEKNVECKKKKAVDMEKNNGGKRQSDKKGKKDLVTAIGKKDKDLTDTTNNIEKSIDIKNEIKASGDSAKKDSSQKKKKTSKSKGFVNPLMKSIVRNVPCISKEEIQRPSESNVHSDQLVPNVMNDFIIENEELPCIEDEKLGNVKSDKIVKDEEYVEVEELNISMDSLDYDSQERDDGMITDLKITNDNDNASAPINKNEFGRFGGHCIDNNMDSDSDPFELIEE